MAKGNGGRPMIIGAVRYANGRINRAATEKAQAAAGREEAKKDDAPASPKTQHNKDLWNARCFKGGGFGNHAGDTIGQLWLLGKLDVEGMDETVLLNAGRIWWHGRGVMFKGVDYKTARYERESRSSSTSTELTKPERDYIHYNRMLLDASDFQMDCLADLMETGIDDTFPNWVSRIIQTELLRYIRLPVVELATDQDAAKLEAAVRALVAMAGADAMKKFAA